jgi:hypothetical protein
VFRELLTYMMEDARTISMCTHLLFGAKNIERIGDHTTNIAENIFYLVTGDAPKGDRPRKMKPPRPALTCLPSRPAISPELFHVRYHPDR